jgi:hypothetical protein
MLVYGVMSSRSGAFIVALLAVACASPPPRDHRYFEAHLGERVTLTGRLPTAAIWQHMTGHVPDKTIVYIDLDGGHQIVTHMDRQPDCRGDIEMTGKVFEVRGPSKGAHRGEQGAEREQYWEYALDVDSWRCR